MFSLVFVSIEIDTEGVEDGLQPSRVLFVVW